LKYPDEEKKTWKTACMRKFVIVEAHKRRINNNESSPNNTTKMRHIPLWDNKKKQNERGSEPTILSENKKENEQTILSVCTHPSAPRSVGWARCSLRQVSYDRSDNDVHFDSRSIACRCNLIEKWDATKRNKITFRFSVMQRGTSSERKDIHFILGT
jgi:hypothetical protein